MDNEEPISFEIEGELRFVEEIWGPTDAQRRYEPVTTLSGALGNTEVGDGGLFKGRGPIQLTGRANYRRFGDLLPIASAPRSKAPSGAGEGVTPGETSRATGVRAKETLTYFFAGGFAVSTILRSKAPSLSTKKTHSDALSQDVVCR